jgi:hypothetical protein
VETLPQEQFELLNGIEPGAPLAPGQKVKLVVN